MAIAALGSNGTKMLDVIFIGIPNNAAATW